MTEGISRDNGLEGKCSLGHTDGSHYLPFLALCGHPRRCLLAQTSLLLSSVYSEGRVKLRHSHPFPPPSTPSLAAALSLKHSFNRCNTHNPEPNGLRVQDPQPGQERMPWPRMIMSSSSLLGQVLRACRYSVSTQSHQPPAHQEQSTEAVAQAG